MQKYIININEVHINTLYYMYMNVYSVRPLFERVGPNYPLHNNYDSIRNTNKIAKNQKISYCTLNTS